MGFRFVIVFCLTFGILVRFVNLGGKVYWHDETYTSLRVSGYTTAEYVEDIFDGQVRDVREISQYQRLRPDSTFKDTIAALAIDNPQHPPLYYVLARFWVDGIGDSVVKIRSLSAIISLFVFPAIYWLCWELFESDKIKISQTGNRLRSILRLNENRVGWMAIALLAISPFHLLYAQEARQYSLWIVLILLSSAALLRAMRKADCDEDSWFDWGLYSLMLVSGFYTFLFHGLVAIGHGIYVLGTERLRWTPKLQRHLIYTAISVFAFLPWIGVFWVNYEQFDKTISWTEQSHFSSLKLLDFLLVNISKIFADFDVGFYFIDTNIAKSVVFLALGYSLYCMSRRASPKVRWFLWTLVSVTIVFLLGPDLILGGIRSLSTRYLIPSLLAFHLVLAWAIEKLIFNKNFWQQKLGLAIALIFGLAGISSCLFISQSHSSWMKVVSSNLPKAARVVNASDAPLLLGNHNSTNPGNILALSYLLQDKVKVQLFLEGEIPQIPEEFDNIFLFGYSEHPVSQLETQQNLQSQWIVGDNYFSLWQFVKNSG